MDDAELYYETVNVAISQGNVELLHAMYQQSLDYGSVGVVIRGIINEHLCDIAKNAGVAFTFEDLPLEGWPHSEFRVRLSGGEVAQKESREFTRGREG